MADKILERKLTDMKAYIEIPVRVWGERWGTPEYWKQYEKELLWEIRDLEDFINDHRSRDKYSVTIEKTYTLHCKFCGHEFIDGYDGIVDCCDQALNLQEDYIKSLQKEE